MNLKLTVRSEISETWYRVISDFKKGCKPGANRVKEENGDLVTNSTVFWLGGGTISLSY
jgi:hypothetical protein